MPDFRKMTALAAEDAKLTPVQRRQKKWNAAQLLEPTGGVRVPVAQRKKYPCTCTPVKHTRKHHKKTGRCKKGCQCKAGMR
jgi:hypothetical protein